jgi:hypothetical protein
MISDRKKKNNTRYLFHKSCFLEDFLKIEYIAVLLKYKILEKLTKVIALQSLRGQVKFCGRDK